MSDLLSDVKDLPKIYKTKSLGKTKKKGSLPTNEMKLSHERQSFVWRVRNWSIFFSLSPPSLFSPFPRTIPLLPFLPSHPPSLSPFS